MNEFLKKLKSKSIHIVGVTGAEGSSILRFLLKHNIKNITAHDFLQEGGLEKSFKLWHKGISVNEKNKLFSKFSQDLKKVNFFSGRKYLEGITSADIIFVPQSWRLYKINNQALQEAQAQKIPFYSLTRLYLDFAKAKTVGVTGTVGKGSTGNIIFQILKKCLPFGRKVYFAGNESWMVQLADKLDEMGRDDVLVLEISHRQLMDGFSRHPDIAIITNLYPNHLDEVSWDDYNNLKFSLVKSQTKKDYSILNYDILPLRQLSSKLKSKTVFFSSQNINMNSKLVQNISKWYLNNKNVHYIDNVLAASSAVEILGCSDTQIIKSLRFINSLPARLEMIGSLSSINFYDDIKSTTPWATLAALKKLGGNSLLIFGGRTKGIDYREIFNQIIRYSNKLIVLKSELSSQIKKYLSGSKYHLSSNLREAIEFAYLTAHQGENILISPGAGFFYTDFIKGKSSLKKIITSLPPKGKVV